jgi:hypothetical protein
VRTEWVGGWPTLPAQYQTWEKLRDRRDVTGFPEATPKEYNYRMARPIRVDNSRPATVRDTAKTLGVSKTRTDELIEQVREMIYRDAKTGQIVIRAKKSGTVVGNGVRNNRSRNASTKAHKTTSRRAKASR